MKGKVVYLVESGDIFEPMAFGSKREAVAEARSQADAGAKVTVKAKVEPNCGVLSGKAVEEIVLDKCPPDTQVLAVKSVTQTRKTGRCA